MELRFCTTCQKLMGFEDNRCVICGTEYISGIPEKPKKKYRIFSEVIIEAETEEEAYEQGCDILQDKSGDWEIEEVKDKKGGII